jgi:hypothetical protein
MPSTNYHIDKETLRSAEHMDINGDTPLKWSFYIPNQPASAW